MMKEEENLRLSHQNVGMEGMAVCIRVKKKAAEGLKAGISWASK